MSDDNSPQIGGSFQYAIDNQEPKLKRVEDSVLVLQEVIKRAVSPTLEGISGSSDIEARIQHARDRKPDDFDPRSTDDCRLDNLSTLIRELAWVIHRAHQHGEIVINRPQDQVETFSTPADYTHPEHAERAVFQIGDRVLTPSGEVCSVIAIRPSYDNRANEQVDLPMYQIDSKLPGSPIVWFFGWQLRRED